MGLPEWLIAKTEDEYVLAAVRLATQHQERVALRERYAGEGKVDVLFQGRAHIMGQRFLECLETFEK